jgi:serine protease Do
MKMWLESCKTRCKAVMTSRVLAALLAVVAVGSVATFTFTKSARAAAAPAPAAAPLDDNSVGALLTLDRAMETLAARVTPAVVNVTVVSKGNAHENGGQEGSPDMQQFFGPGGPFGRQFQMPSQPQERMEHGLGSGVIISPDGYIVTNNHVIEGAVDIRVTMSNKEVLSAKLIGADPLTDLAVIKVGACFRESVWVSLYRDARHHQRAEPSQS